MILAAWILGLAAGSDEAARERDFFEARIRPVLVERCYRCHNSHDRARGGLALDHREGLRRGGRSGPALIPGDPGRSLLMRSLRHDPGAPRMPREEPRLEPAQLADFRDWIEGGAVDPRDAVPTRDELAAETAWEAVQARRSEWWSFQPLGEAPRPHVADADWPRQPLDHFVLARLESEGLRPSPDADRRSLLRRASLVLTGLPPSPEELARFETDPDPAAYEREVDRLLQDPSFAERWAQHWLDLFRYAGSHGSEGDPRIPNASVYRDAVVRAFEQDVPYDRRVLEHLAGDQLPPRFDPVSGVDDAEASLAHLRMVQHGYGPTDALDEKVRFLDNQIDVVSKAFLGLTLSCARCHDHKFDPISQDDYFSLFGILASDRPGQRSLRPARDEGALREELDTLQQSLRVRLAEIYLAALPAVEPALFGLPGDAAKAMEQPHSALDPWIALRGSTGEERAERWRRLRAELQASRRRLEQRARHRFFPSANDEPWYAHGTGLDDGRPQPAGSFRILPRGERILDAIRPSGFHSDRRSRKDSASLGSPDRRVDFHQLWIRAAGSGGARARPVVQHYPRVAGPPYKARGLDSARARWLSFDLEYWEGDDIHLELATARDLPVEARNEERSSFSLLDVLCLPAGAAPPREELAEVHGPLLEAAHPPEDPELAASLVQRLRAALEAWRDARASDQDARLLDGFLVAELLPTRLGDLPGLAPLVERARRIESELAVPRRVPGPIPGPRVQQARFVRGDHRRPADELPHAFLQVLPSQDYPADGSSRLRWAEDLVRPDNPLTARVAVNRFWHWVFGQGLVRTCDNFGLLGEEASHPALLDHLAREFMEDGWSVRRLLRRLVLSRTFQQSSAGRPELRERDPEDRLLARMPPYRLDAESLRDSILWVSGRLDPTRLGPSVGEESPRRSLYLARLRNAPSPFLSTFDAPLPSTTTGRRDRTQVPAQALLLMNDPLVVDSAREWAARVLREPRSEEARLRAMFERALGREATAEELAAATAFVREVEAEGVALADRQGTLRGQHEEARALAAGLLERGRQRVRSEREPAGAAQRSSLPQPFAAWDFEQDLEDSVARLHGEFVGSARIEEGALVLDGGGHVRTAPIPRAIGARTLEVVVRLDDLDQRGAGVISIQDARGEVFDAIVYAEREPRRWMAGSDHFRRTADAGGPPEEAVDFVHLAARFSDDGSIQLYRNGQPHGQSTRVGPLQSYAAGDAQLLFGLRHGTPAQPRGPLRGRIERAALYDRALDDEEIAALAVGDPDFVPRAEALAALEPAERRRHARTRAHAEQLQRQEEELRRVLEGEPPRLRAWRSLAQALFQLQEFQSLR